MLHPAILAIFVTLLPCSALAANSISQPGFESNHTAQQQEEEDNQVDVDEKPNKKNRKKIRFANWHSWVRWMFSMEKWEPAINALKIVFDSLFDSAIPTYDDSVIPTADGFPPFD